MSRRRLVSYPELLFRRASLLNERFVYLSSDLDPASLRECEEIEAHNRKVFLANSYLTQSLIARLEYINRDSSGESTALWSKPGPLAMMGLLQTLEVCLCSRAGTTGSVEFATLVEGVAKCYSTLLKELRQSRYGTIVEACTYLLTFLIALARSRLMPRNISVFVVVVVVSRYSVAEDNPRRMWP